MVSVCVALIIIWQHLKRPGIFFGCSSEEMHTFVQVISGAGTPAARQGREMGVPSIVLNTWGPCWMVGITGKMKAKEDTEEFHHRAFTESTPCILSSALNLCLDVSTSVPPLISCVSHEHLERSCSCTAQYRCSYFTFVLFFPLTLLFCDSVTPRTLQKRSSLGGL